MGQTSILVSSLYLTSAVGQPTTGRLSEEFGPRRIFLVGIAIVAICADSYSLPIGSGANVAATERVWLGLG